MPLRNVLLCAYHEAHVEVEDAPSVAAHGRREGYLELGNIEDRDVVIDAATAVLSVQAQRRSTVVVDPMPRLGVDGFIDYGLGDTVTGWYAGPVRVVGITIAMDDEGRASVIPELKDRVSVREEEVNRLLRRLADGGLDGATEQASQVYPDVPPVLPGRVVELPSYTFDGVLVDGLISPPYNPFAPMQIIHLVGNLRVPGSTDTHIRVVDDNGNERCDLLIPAGRTLYAADIDPEYVSPQTQLITQVMTAGVDAEGLVFTMQVTTT